MCERLGIAAVALICAAGGAQATEYYVAEKGVDSNDGLTADTAFASIDKAVSTAGNGTDVIYVAPGTYETTTQWGPQLKAKLIGTGASRGDVVIKAQGAYRTMRTASTGWIENVTIIGNTDVSKADKGAAIEMSGGTVTNCVITSGAAYGNDSKYSGGNIYMSAGLVVDCEIKDGKGSKNGGNICMTGGTVKACTISNGSSDGEGGSVFMNGGTVSGCTILANGTTKGSGGGIYLNGSGCTVEDTLVDGKDGVMSWHGGCIYMKNGTVRNTTCQNGVCTSASSRAGGNIYMENGKLEDVTLLNGTCSQEGGNLNIRGGSATGLICRGGTSGSNGGNIRATGTVTITGAVIEDGTIKSDDLSSNAPKGANIYIDGNVKLIRSKLTGGTNLKNDGTTPGYESGSICMWSGTVLIDTCLVTGSNCGGILSGTTGHVYGTTIVNNNAYGYWSWNASQTLQNCVIFGNTKDGKLKEYAGNQPSGDNGSCINCAVSENSLSKDKYPTLTFVTEADFVDYANGDYRPGETSKLVDAGATDTREGAQVLDLAGKARLSEGIDIGCYEYQHSNMTVSFTVPVLEPAFTPATATFTATAVNAPGEVTYAVDFGDGTVQDFTTETISHVYTTRGTYTISVVAKSGEATSKPMTRTVKIVDKVLRVGEGGFASIAAAVAEALDGCEIVVSAGAYEVTEPIVLNKAVTMTGDGAVVIRNVSTASASAKVCRVLTVGNGAVVKGFVIENGQVYNDNGGCVSIDTGTLEGCIIRGGLATADGGNASGAGVFISGAATLRRCTVTGNTVNGTSSGSGDICGGAVFVKNGANPKITNTLVADNVYISTDATRTGAAGVMYGGKNENALMENCTVAGNLVQGSLKQASAGAYCTSWSAIFRNNVFAANRETGREGASAVYIDSHNTVTYCITDTAEAVNANCFTATAAEMFRNVTGKNYQPKAQGALWNKGTTPSEKESTDLLGKPRVMFDIIDLGCYEAQHKLSFTVTIR